MREYDVSTKFTSCWSASSSSCVLLSCWFDSIQQQKTMTCSVFRETSFRVSFSWVWCLKGHFRCVSSHMRNEWPFSIFSLVMIEPFPFSHDDSWLPITQVYRTYKFNFFLEMVIKSWEQLQGKKNLVEQGVTLFLYLLTFNSCLKDCVSFLWNNFLLKLNTTVIFASTVSRKEHSWGFSESPAVRQENMRWISLEHPTAKGYSNLERSSLLSHSSFFRASSAWGCKWIFCLLWNKNEWNESDAVPLFASHFLHFDALFSLLVVWYSHMSSPCLLLTLVWQTYTPTLLHDMWSSLHEVINGDRERWYTLLIPSLSSPKALLILLMMMICFYALIMSASTLIYSWYILRSV